MAERSPSPDRFVRAHALLAGDAVVQEITERLSLLTDVGPGDVPGDWTFVVVGGDISAGRGLRDDWSTAEIVVDLAAFLQDEVIEEVRAAWPPCPGHQHPMWPQLDAGGAWWVCQTDGPRRPIGAVHPVPDAGGPGRRRRPGG